MSAKKKKSAGPGKAVSGGDDGGASAEPYVVLARKYRPQVFDDLIGQDAMVATLRNAFASGRIAQGYMLTGVRGVGKTTTARILARALNFARDGGEDKPTTDLPREPADYGRHCADIMVGRHPDVIEMDAASNTGVDNIREIIESARYKPLIARYKVFIIDEVHMLSKGAFNALLKTLEEPPEHVKFIFATTEIRKVPVTVLSRCQRFDLRRVDVAALKQHFQRIVASEGAKADDDALVLIARAAGGSVRDGLSILDQAIAFSEGAVTDDGVRAMIGLADSGRVFDLVELMLGGKAGEALAALDALHRDGAEPVQILNDLAEVVHVATRAKVAGADAGAEVLSAEEKRRAVALADRLSIPLLSRAWQMLVKGMEDVARAPNQQAAVEMVLVRIAYTADLPAPDELIKTLGGQAVPANGAGRAAPASQASETRSAKAEAHEPAAPRTREPASKKPDQGGPAEPQSAPPAQPPVTEQPFDPAQFDAVPPWEDVVNEFAELDPDDPAAADDLMPATGDIRPDPRSFADVVTLIGSRRDARLKILLEDKASLVKFEVPPPGEDGRHAIDLHLLPGAPAEIANELREKLNRWTGKRWIVMLSKTPGEIPIGEARRQAAAEELARLKTAPIVKSAFEAFPDLEVAEVREIDSSFDDEDTGTG